ncbi:MAG: hypothetical protein QOI13_1759 [Paraburkholderia sp.]|nr:hypothetical protein [Paraburkholderia sp.]
MTERPLYVGRRPFWDADLNDGSGSVTKALGENQRDRLPATNFRVRPKSVCIETLARTLGIR